MSTPGLLSSNTFRRRERILIITPVGLHGRGGIDRLNLYFARHLEGDHDAPELVFLGSRGEWKGPFWIAYFLWSLLRFISHAAFGRFDLIHIHVSTDGSAFRKCMFGLIARLWGQPYAIHFHGDIKQAMEATPPLWVKALGNLARGAECVIVLGRAFVEPFRVVLGVREARICIVHNGIADIGREAVIPRAQRDRVHLLFSGEVGKRKGIDLLIGALMRLQRRNRDWVCTIAGNGDIESWRRKVETSGLAEQVRFTGWLDIGAIHLLMNDADIVVLPSRAEALPLALIEGASAGAALVASDVGAVRDVVLDGVNGRIVPHDEDAIADTLASLIGNGALRAEMQCASRKHYLQYFEMGKFVADVRRAHDMATRRAVNRDPAASAAE